MKTREDGIALLLEYTKGDSLLRHALCVEASMKWYADHFKCSDEEKVLWQLTGLLHDFDYEQHPDPTPPDGHPYFGNKVLAELGWSESIRTAIMGHAVYSGVPRDTLMAKTLFAVDELSGFVYAAALVRPDKSLELLEARSVIKKTKDKAFAKGCNREEMRQGAEELGIPFEEHVNNIILALRAADLDPNQLRSIVLEKVAS